MAEKYVWLVQKRAGRLKRDKIGGNVSLYTKAHLDRDLDKAERANSMLSGKLLRGEVNGFQLKALEDGLEKFQRRCRMRFLKCSQLMQELRAAQHAVRACGIDPESKPLPKPSAFSEGSRERRALEWLKAVRQQLYWETKDVPELPEKAGAPVSEVADAEVAVRVFDTDGKFLRWEAKENHRSP